MIDTKHSIIISEYSKLAGMVIHMELCKKVKFDYMNKWYIHNQKFVLEIDMNKLLWDFKIQIYHLISARWPDQVIVNKNIKRTCQILDYRVKLKESEMRDKCLDFAL